MEREKNRTTRRRVLSTAFGILALASIAPLASSGVVTLNPGDLVIGDQFSDMVIHVDPSTGVQTMITSGGMLDNTFGVDIDAGGQIILSDTAGGLISVDPATGGQTAVPNSVTHFTRSLVIEPGGDLFVGGYDPTVSGGISRVDPVTGTTNLITSGGSLNDNFDIVLDVSGDLIVGNAYGPSGAGTGPLIVRVNPIGGVQTTVSNGGILQQVTGLTWSNSGLLVAVGNVFVGTPGLYTVHPTTGNQTMLSSGGFFDQPIGVDADANGDYVVTDRGSDTVFRVDRNTGAQTLLSSAGLFTGPCSVKVVDGPGGAINPFCFGDGTGTTCPCGNSGASGHGCRNSNPNNLGTELSGFGNPTVGADTLVLQATDGPINKPGMFFQGNNAINGGMGNPWKDGIRCVGGGVVRLNPVVFTDGTGMADTTGMANPISVTGSVSAGDTKRYQFWHRDGPGVCGFRENFSNGLRVFWN